MRRLLGVVLSIAHSKFAAVWATIGEGGVPKSKKGIKVVGGNHCDTRGNAVIGIDVVAKLFVTEGSPSMITTRNVLVR